MHLDGSSITKTTIDSCVVFFSMTPKIFANNVCEAIENCNSIYGTCWKLQLSLVSVREKNDDNSVDANYVVFFLIYPCEISLVLMFKAIITATSKKSKSLTNYLLVISLNLYLVLIVFSGLLKGRDAVKIRKRNKNKLISKHISTLVWLKCANCWVHSTSDAHNSQ